MTEDELTAQLNAVYAERDKCVALALFLAQKCGLRTWIGQHEDKPDEPWDEGWRNVAYIELPTGQVSWHFSEDELPWFRRIPQSATPWDGHSTPEKYQRIMRYLNSAE